MRELPEIHIFAPIVRPQSQPSLRSLNYSVCKPSILRPLNLHGNRVRYTAKVKDSKGNQLGRWDVFLVSDN